MNPVTRFCEILYQRDLSSKQHLITEALRVLITKRYINKHNIPYAGLKDSPEELFEIMKRCTVLENLGYFPGDRELFARLFDIGQDFDIAQFTSEVYSNDRSGTVISPWFLTEYIEDRIRERTPKSVLITEAEKYYHGLKNLISKHKDKFFCLTTESYLMKKVLELTFVDTPYVEVVYLSVYRKIPFQKKYDLVCSIPNFGVTFQKEDMNDDFICRESEGIATENLLNCISENGCLNIILPAKFAFSGGNLTSLREWIKEKYSLDSIYILPEGIFRPYTAIKTYMLEISKDKSDYIRLGTFSLEGEDFQLTEFRDVKVADFYEYTEWRIELFLAKIQEEVERFKETSAKKVKLNELGEIFRGKSILKGDVKPGEYAVLNISNIENGEVQLVGMDTIDEDERKLKRYELIAGDLVITCRGTVNKVAVFPETDKKVIASANIIVVRFKEGVLSDYVKIFLESPLGTTLVQAFQRGSTVMNINPNDLGQVEIPLLDLEEQQQIVDLYYEELNRYKEAIRLASMRWNEKRSGIYNSLLR